MSEATTVTITTYAEAKDAYRQKALRQALYDAGEVVMGDVLVNLHGEEHRNRRRLENRLFRRDTLERYEHELFPDVIGATLAPHAEAGHSETVKLGHEMMMNLAALTAGIDRPKGTPEETFHLYDYLMRFIEGATLAHYTGDIDAKRAEVARKLDEFDAEFLTPSIARRRAMIEAGEEPPADILTVLLQNREQLDLPHEVVLREVSFYLLAGAHTSATAFTRTLHRIFMWIADHPTDRERAQADPVFVQRCLHETIRLEPSSPVAMRWALEDVRLRTGTLIPQGAKAIIDLMAVNRDVDVFGADAAEFDPHRDLPDGVMPWGLSFGSGMHACIGSELAGGLVFADGEDRTAHLHGLVPQAVVAMLQAGARPDPEQPAVMDTTTERPYWGSYPVLFH
jgi:cytochrome P450